MNTIEAKRIALQVTRDLDLHPPLTATRVKAVIEGSVLFLPALGPYGDEWRATIESRILQEADPE